ARAARRHGGWGVLRRGFGRPLPAAHGRGDSHRALLRARVRSGVAGGRRWLSVARAGADPVPHVLGVACVPVPFAAPVAAARSTRRAATPRRRPPRDAGEALRRLVIRPLPEDRAPELCRAWPRRR